ncbi:hypothetical protein B0T24DRAFT_84020 [Lasiosphaeria ovina]|uniref:D-xylose 1-dehydrogenase (NADP(+), D-xylono-1,5-lactone-forming) n=1 Tax=Lasiosphaeria ovina TaxID=92902 RepID=A0AAE0NMW6_9PEZI|nr:hypothetical protein B0T24DRAFT_84020 [Lasiosphaeria ovina]
MASLFGALQRNWRMINPPTPLPPKAENALRIGILGAANIAPMALINPAKLHPEVIVQAIAARDKTKAAAYAKKHGIPQVLGSYQEILDDPSIDAVYIPLPNGLHFEWALKALAKGKHVLLEKPAFSNAAEAERLLQSPKPQQQPAPVLLEAFHYRFHPAWARFLSFVDQPNIAHATASLNLASMLFAKDDIRFRYDLSGGALMDLTYTMSVLRGVYGTEPEECTSCEVGTMEPPNELCDYKYDGTWRFPNGGTGEMHGTLRGGLVQMLRSLPSVTVTHRAVAVEPHEYAKSPSAAAPTAGQETVRTRTVTLNNYIMPTLWHRIDVVDDFVVRDKTTLEPIRRWSAKQTAKAYTRRDAGLPEDDAAAAAAAASQPSWSTYKHQLDAFVDRIRGRPGTGAWVTAEDTLNQMRMIDMAYSKAGLALRPTSSFDPALAV